MVRNVRWLYNKLGTVDISGIGNGTVSSGVNTVQSGLNGKADSGHAHGVGDLPVSNSQVNSTSYIPSSSVVYDLNNIINELGTEIDNLIEAMNPNNNYESKSLGTWSRASDVDAFLNTYNHANNYDGLSLGNYVTIPYDLTSVQFVIAGFDMEHNQTAADGTVYDNGYGICLIPKTRVVYGKWNNTVTTTGAYMSSYMHTTLLPNIVTKLKNVLGNHIVNRNVLLSSTYTSGTSTAYTWTTADATLMSIGQMTGTFASHSNKYDDGEANYKLPLFDYENYWTSDRFWSRGMYSNSAWFVDSDGDIVLIAVNGSDVGVRPLIYIR